MVMYSKYLWLAISELLLEVELRTTLMFGWRVEGLRFYLLPGRYSIHVNGPNMPKHVQTHLLGLVLDKYCDNQKQMKEEKTDTNKTHKMHMKVTSMESTYPLSLDSAQGLSESTK